MSERAKARRATETELRGAVALIEAHALHLRGEAMDDRSRVGSGVMSGMYSTAALALAGAVMREHGAQGGRDAER